MAIENYLQHTLDGFLSLWASSMIAYCHGIWERKSLSISAMSYVVNSKSKGKMTCQKNLITTISVNIHMTTETLHFKEGGGTIQIQWVHENITHTLGVDDFLVTCSRIFMRRLRRYSLSPTYLKTSSLGANLTISDTQPSVTLKGHITTVKVK